MKNTPELTLTSRRIKSCDGTGIMTYTAGDKEKPALVFVHGYPDNHGILKKLMAHFLADYFVITYDVRGTGNSDKPKHASDYKLEHLADDLWCVTTELLATKPFHVVAHDWGSIQTWESACQPRYQDKMLSFTSLSGPSIKHVNWALKHQGTAEKLKQFSRSWYILLLHLPVVPKLYWKKLAPKWSALMKLPENRYQYADAVNGRLLYQANIFPEQQRYKKAEALPKAICPVYLPIFTKDEFVTPILFENMEDWVADLTREELPLKHWGIYYQAEMVAERIHSYLSHKFPS